MTVRKSAAVLLVWLLAWTVLPCVQAAPAPEVTVQDVGYYQLEEGQEVVPDKLRDGLLRVKYTLHGAAGTKLYLLLTKKDSHGILREAYIERATLTGEEAQTFALEMQLTDADTSQMTAFVFEDTTLRPLGEPWPFRENREQHTASYTSAQLHVPGDTPYASLQHMESKHTIAFDAATYYLSPASRLVINGVEIPDGFSVAGTHHNAMAHALFEARSRFEVTSYTDNNEVKTMSVTSSSLHIPVGVSDGALLLADGTRIELGRPGVQYDISLDGQAISLTDLCAGDRLYIQYDITAGLANSTFYHMEAVRGEQGMPRLADAVTLRAQVEPDAQGQPVLHVLDPLASGLQADALLEDVDFGGTGLQFTFYEPMEVTLTGGTSQWLLLAASPVTEAGNVHALTVDKNIEIALELEDELIFEYRVEREDGLLLEQIFPALDAKLVINGKVLGGAMDNSHKFKTLTNADRVTFSGPSDAAQYTQISAWFYKYQVIQSVDQQGELITLVSGDTLDLSACAYHFVYGDAPLAVSDLRPGDVLSIAYEGDEQKDAQYALVQVCRDTVEGRVTEQTTIYGSDVCRIDNVRYPVVYSMNPWPTLDAAGLFHLTHDGKLMWWQPAARQVYTAFLLDVGIASYDFTDACQFELLLTDGRGNGFESDKDNSRIEVNRLADGQAQTTVYADVPGAGEQPLDALYESLKSEINAGKYGNKQAVRVSFDDRMNVVGLTLGLPQLSGLTFEKVTAQNSSYDA